MTKWIFCSKPLCRSVNVSSWTALRRIVTRGLGMIGLRNIKTPLRAAGEEPSDSQALLAQDQQLFSRSQLFKSFKMQFVTLLTLFSGAAVMALPQASALVENVASFEGHFNEACNVNPPNPQPRQYQNIPSASCRKFDGDLKAIRFGFISNSDRAHCACKSSSIATGYYSFVY